MRLTPLLLASMLMAAITAPTPQVFAAESMEKSAWEKVCDQGVIAACRKASTMLEEKLVKSENPVEESKTRARLLSVDRLACAKNDVAACSSLFMNSDDPKGNDVTIATAQLDQACKGGNQKACEENLRLKDSAEINVTELEFAAEFLTASK